MSKLIVRPLIIGLLMLCPGASFVRAVEGPASPATAPTTKPRPNTTQPTPLENVKTYDYPGRHAKILKIKAELNPNVVLIGDSITHHWGGPPGDQLKNGEKVLQSDLSAYRTLNLGFGHDRTQGVLWRLQNGELDGLNPDWVVINIGSNNTSDGNSADEIFAGIKAVCEQVRARTPKARIVLMSIFPRDLKPTSARRVLIDKINEMISVYAKEQQFVHLDIGKQFLDAEGNVRKDLLPDTCHPNADGYRIWAKALLDVFTAKAQP